MENIHPLYRNSANHKRRDGGFILLIPLFLIFFFIFRVYFILPILLISIVIVLVSRQGKYSQGPYSRVNSTGTSNTVDNQQLRPNFCKNCGEEVESDSTFCPGCGFRLI